MIHREVGGKVRRQVRLTLVQLMYLQTKKGGNLCRERFLKFKAKR